MADRCPCSSGWRPAYHIYLDLKHISGIVVCSVAYRVPCVLKPSSVLVTARSPVSSLVVKCSNHVSRF